MSVGSNDLTQYVMAADRTNDAVGDLYQPGHEAMWRLLGTLVDAARPAGRHVAVCGELGEPSGGAAGRHGRGRTLHDAERNSGREDGPANPAHLIGSGARWAGGGPVTSSAVAIARRCSTARSRASSTLPIRSSRQWSASYPIAPRW